MTPNGATGGSGDPMEPGEQKGYPPIWLVWLGLAFVLLTSSWGDIAAGRLQEADDYMRMLQVRDWLNGQAWFDTRQYRLDPPTGAEMHWVRLVDLPLAAMQFLLGSFLAPALAEKVTMAALPLLHLLLTMYLLRGVARALGASRPVQLLCALLAPAFPLVLYNFSPARVDHHAWQAFAGLVMAWAMLKDSWRHALLAGLAGAVLLMISLEGIVPAAIFGALFALRYWLEGKRQHEAFLLGLGLGILALFAVFRPIGEIWSPMCDLPSIAHVAAFGGGALVAALSRLMPKQDRAHARLISLFPIPVVAAAALFIPLGWCVVSPLQLDPYMRQFWFDNMVESASFPSQAFSTATMTLWTVLLAAAGMLCGWRLSASESQRRGWLFLGLAALGTGVYSLMLTRAGLTAQLLTVPMAATLIAHYLPRARSLAFAPKRIAATLMVIGLGTPLLPTSAAKPFDRPIIMSIVQPPSSLTLGDCKVERLNSLPLATFYTTLDRAPELLARTPHKAIMSGYHRNMAKMEDVVRAFEGPITEAETRVRSSGADYLMFCAISGDLWLAASSGQDSLATRFVNKRPMPSWLQPMPEFDTGSFRLYRIQR